MSRRRLPLTSANWLPLNAAHKLVAAQTGSPHLAARDLTEALRDGRLRSLGRKARPDSDNPERHLLTAGFWADWQITSWSDGPQVTPNRKRQGWHIVVPLKTLHCYIWRPDFAKIFGIVVAAAAPSRRQPERETQQEPRQTNKQKARRGAKPQYDREQIKAEIRNRKQRPTAPEMVEWCKERGLKPPTDRQMARYIADVFDREETERT